MNELSTNILLIEDDISHATLMSRWLESVPEYRVKHVSSGFAGIDLAVATEWDLVICDIALPDIDGLELCKQAKFEHALMPVLITTAHESLDYQLKAIENKVDDFLLKPFKKDCLLAKTKRLLETSRLEKSKKQGRVLAIGAHPDDITLGCGGSLLRHKANGDKLCIMTISDRESAKDSGNQLEGFSKVAEQLRSNVIVGNLNIKKTVDQSETVNLIEKAIAHFCPTVIYTHSPHDSHIDHKDVYLATIAAAKSVPSIYCYLSTTVTSTFNPGLFVDISTHIDEKVALASYSKNPLVHNRSRENSIRSSAQYWGSFHKVSGIEPLEVIRVMN